MADALARLATGSTWRCLGKRVGGDRTGRERVMSDLRRIVARHGVWLLATAVVALVVTVVTGWFLFPVYAVANAAGTVLYLDGLRGPRARLRRVVVPLLTVLMVPVGLVMGLGRRRVDPTDAVLGHEDIRNNTAASNVYADRSRHMGTGF